MCCRGRQPVEQRLGEPLVEKSVEPDLDEVDREPLVGQPSGRSLERVVDAGRRTDQQQPANQLGMVERELQTDATTHRIAEVGGRSSDRGDEGGRGGKIGFGVPACTVARRIDGADEARGGEELVERCPAALVLGEPMNQHERGAVAVASVAVREGARILRVHGGHRRVCTDD